MSNNTIVKGKRFIIMNTANGAVQVVIAKSYRKAFEQARAYFGKTPLYVKADSLSTR